MKGRMRVREAISSSFPRVHVASIHFDTALLRHLYTSIYLCIYPIYVHTSPLRLAGLSTSHKAFVAFCFCFNSGCGPGSR